MNDKEFIEAVFYNSDGIHWVKRYYTVQELYDINNNELRNTYRIGLCKYLKSIDVEVFQSSIYVKNFLDSIGVIVDNKELTVKILCFSKECNVDEVEEKIIREAKRFKHNIKPLTAHMDLEKLNSKYFGGQLDLNRKGKRLELINESIAKPSDISDIASFMINTLGGLSARGNTVVVTDDYLFKPKNDNQYEINLKAILKSLSAKEVIHYGEGSKINQQLFNNVKKFLKKNGTTLTHKDISDFHDRFWIIKETNRGVLIGTSLNGVGKKLFYYNEIENIDAVEVLSYLPK